MKVSCFPDLTQPLRIWFPVSFNSHLDACDQNSSHKDQAKDPRPSKEVKVICVSAHIIGASHAILHFPILYIPVWTVKAPQMSKTSLTGRKSSPVTFWVCHFLGERKPTHSYKEILSLTDVISGHKKPKHTSLWLWQSLLIIKRQCVNLKQTALWTHNRFRLFCQHLLKTVHETVFNLSI